MLVPRGLPAMWTLTGSEACRCQPGSDRCTWDMPESVAHMLAGEDLWRCQPVSPVTSATTSTDAGPGGDGTFSALVDHGGAPWPPFACSQAASLRAEGFSGLGTS